MLGISLLGSILGLTYEQKCCDCKIVNFVLS